MKVRNIVITAVVVVGVLYGGAKAYVYQTSKNFVDETLQRISPFVAVNYKSFSASLDGKFVLRGVTIEPRRLNDEIDVERIELQTPDVDFIFNSGKAYKRREIPKSLKVAIHGLTLDTDGQIFKILTRSASAEAARQGRRISGCGTVDPLGLKELREVGGGTLILDMGASYLFGEGTGGVRVHLDQSIRNAQSMSLDATISGVDNELREWSHAQPLLTYADLHMGLDSATIKKVRSYCATEAGISEDAFLKQTINQPDQAYLDRFHIVPGPGLRAAYLQLLKQGGELVIKARPKVPIELRNLTDYTPKDMVALFNPKVEINGKPVTDLSFNTEPGAGPAVDQKADTRGELVHHARFRRVKTRELSKYLGRDVKIFTTDGKLRAGLLSAVREGVLTIEQRVYGGSLTVQVPSADVEKAEVFM